MSRTKEDCHLEALKYKTRNEFKKNSYGVYQTSNRKGWMDEICSHMIRLRQSRTKEDCHLEALKYKTRNEFKKNSYAIYYYSVRYNWMDEICSHMNAMNVNRTKEDCHLEALNYSRRIDFSLDNPNTYYYAVRYGWLDDICEHMEYNMRPEMNTLYAWKVKNELFWKIGICSYDRLYKRINEVAFSNNFQIEKVMMKYDKNCRVMEQNFLKLGSKVELDKNQGYTEFRIFEDSGMDKLYDYFRN